MSKFLFFFIYFKSDFIPLLAVLHPSHKLAYFAQAGWPDEWDATAEEIVCAEFERAYVDIEIEDSNGTVSIHIFLILFKSYSKSYFV